MLNTDILLTLRAMVRGAYDLQQLRMQSGLRLCANVRARITPEDLAKIRDDDKDEGEDAVEEIEIEPDADEDIDEAAKKKAEDKKKKKIIKIIKAEYRRLTDGITSKKGQVMMKKLDLTGSPIISTAAEFTLVQSYLALEKQEAKQFRDLTGTLEEIPIYSQYLRDVVGVGPAMAGVLISYLDPYQARHVSGFWKYSGLDVDKGSGRSRREEHLVEREYKAKNGEIKTRLGVTYNPFLKTKLMGVLGPSFLRAKSPKWRPVYDGYRNRILSDPARIKVTVAAWKKLHKAADPNLRDHWTPGRIHTASTRYMVKMFLQELWLTWRTLEGLPVTLPYSEDKLGRPPHAA